MRKHGCAVWLGVAVLAAVWAIATPAHAITVMCSNPLGECEVSNDNFDSVSCDCGMLGGDVTGGGDEWETLSEAELLEICEAELEVCGEFDPSTSGSESGDTGVAVGTTSDTGSSTTTETSADADTGSSSGDATGSSGESEGSSDSGGVGCGNGVVDEGEECDIGADNGTGLGCKSDCTQNLCPDGYVGP